MSNIGWTDETWNPTTGCHKVSQGCKRCYAEKMHKRLQSMGTKGYEMPFLEGAVEQHHALDRPLRWKKPRLVFVNSMSDLFHENVSFAFVSEVMNTIIKCPQHTFQILTKRPERLLKWWDYNSTRGKQFFYFSNALFGVSTEDEKAFRERAPLLKEFSGGRKFLSCEPLIGPIEMSGDDLDGISWVIVGGESGKGARRMDLAWAKKISDFCQETETAYFFKQTGVVLAKEMGLKAAGADISQKAYREGWHYRQEQPK